jgi:PAS domain S-box-containing protein
MLARLGSLDEVRGFIDVLACPVVVTRGAQIVAVNDAWLAVIGFPRDEVEGHPYMEFVPPEERARVARGVELRAEGVRRPMRLTSLAVKADGTSTIVHVEPTVVPSAAGEPFIVNFVFVVPERDHGRGISEAITERIFEPFFTTRPRGTGLGLAVVRRIADQLSAEIDVASSSGRGATFTLWFDC